MFFCIPNILLHHKAATAVGETFRGGLQKARPATPEHGLVLPATPPPAGSRAVCLFASAGSLLLPGPLQ